jgi:hypothetical protein
MNAFELSQHIAVRLEEDGPAHPSWSRPAPDPGSNAAPIRAATSRTAGTSSSAATTRTTSCRAGVIDTANRHRAGSISGPARRRW